MTEFIVSFQINGETWFFDGTSVDRKTASGDGTPIYYVECWSKTPGKRAVANITSDWKIRSFYESLD